MGLYLLADVLKFKHAFGKSGTESYMCIDVNRRIEG